MGDIRETIRLLERTSMSGPDLDRIIGLTVVRLPHMRGPIHVFARMAAKDIPGFNEAKYPPYTSRLDTAAGLVRLLFPGGEWSPELEPLPGRIAVLSSLHARRADDGCGETSVASPTGECLTDDRAAFAAREMVRTALEAAYKFGRSEAP